MMDMKRDLSKMCEQCKFWEFDDDETDADIGWCHRLPPTNFTVSKRAFDGNFRCYGNRSDFFAQPSTMKWDWCGEWSPLPDNARYRAKPAL